MTTIHAITAHDVRFALPDGAGSDAVHTDPEYGYAVAALSSDDGLMGQGISFHLGGGGELVRRAIELLAEPLQGREIEELMADFGAMQRRLADHAQIRWLGPHKGVVHLALASLSNACFDLWCKHRGLPLWRLLLELTAEQLVDLLDLSYLEDVLTRDQAIGVLRKHQPGRAAREHIIAEGYPGYDTSVGWFAYSDQKITENARRAVDEGFTALKLKVGSPDPARDVQRVRLVREAVGDEVRIMLDANQAWSVPLALDAGRRMAELRPFWIEEPTHPDDVAGHRLLAGELAPIPIAVGESIPNRVVWKNYLQADAVGIVQADCTRLAGVSEYLAVALMATSADVDVVPHVGDMGQIHQHLVLFNHIALAHRPLLLEHIPHLRDRFVHPARVEGGRYETPQEAGIGAELKGVLD